MKTAISIPDNLHKAAEETAHRLGISVDELYRRALGAFVARQQSEGVTEALNRVYGEAGAESHVDPVLEQLQATSLDEDTGW